MINTKKYEVKEIEIGNDVIPTHKAYALIENGCIMEVVFSNAHKQMDSYKQIVRGI